MDKKATVAEEHSKTAADVVPITAENNGQNRPGTFVTGNSHRWPKGVSGNPGGRPKKPILSDVLAEMLEEILPNNAEGRKLRKRFCLGPDARWVNAVAAAMIRRALTQTSAAVEIGNRVEGLPGQRFELAGADGPVTIRVVYDDEPEPKE